MIKEVQNVIDYGWQNLKLAALTFINGYEALEKNKSMLDKQFLLNLMNAVSSSNEDNIYPIIKTVDKGRNVNLNQVARSQEMLIQKFQQHIDVFIGQKIPREGIFVVENKKTGKLKSFYIPLYELAQRVTAERKFGYGTQKGRTILEEQEEFIEGGHAAKAQAAFSAVRSRARRWKEVNKARQLQGFLLMWREMGGWTVAKVSNMGAIKEGYIQALFTKHQSDLDILCQTSSDDPDGYGSHELVKNFYYNYILGVTNMSAILMEDIITNNKQFAVKSNDSRSARHGQYLNTAKLILSQATPLSKEELTEIIQTQYFKTSTQSTIIKEANAIIGQVTDETIKDIKEAVEKFSNINI